MYNIATAVCMILLQCDMLGAIQVLRSFFFWKCDPHPPPRNANNVEQYTFVTIFAGYLTPSHPHCIT